jgi:hypothetical protein
VNWILVAAYLSTAGVPKIETMKFTDKQSCQAKVAKYVAQVRVGSGRAWCVRGRSRNG